MIAWRDLYSRVLKHRVLILLLLIVLAGFSVRALPVRVGAHYWDETVYLQHGEILAGERPNMYNEFAFRPPLLSVILGGVFAVHNSLVAAHLFIAFLAAAGIAVLYLLGRDLYGPSTGIVAAIIYLLSTEHVRVSHTTLVDGVLPTAWLLTAYLLLRAVDTQRRRYAVPAGVAIGLAVLLKFTSLVLIPTAVGILLLAYYEQRGSSSPVYRIRSWLDAARSSLLWPCIAGCLLALAPYMLWSFTVFGHPLHPFISGIQASGAPSPLFTYLSHAQVLFPIPFAAGFVLFLPLLKRLPDRTVYYPLLFVLALGVPLQFMIAHKEPRYILPVIPFLALIAARGLSTVRQHLPSPRVTYPVLITGLVTATLLTTPIISLYVSPPLTGTVTFSDPGDPTHDVATWINDNTPPDSTVYGNYELSVLAYYGNRTTIHLPRTENMSELTAVMENTGYFVYTDRAPDYFTPDLDTVRADPRFSETYKNERTYVFAYAPAQLNSAALSP